MVRERLRQPPGPPVSVTSLGELQQVRPRPSQTKSGSRRRSLFRFSPIFEPNGQHAIGRFGSHLGPAGRSNKWPLPFLWCHVIGGGKDRWQVSGNLRPLEAPPRARWDSSRRFEGAISKLEARKVRTNFGWWEQFIGFDRFEKSVAAAAGVSCTPPEPSAGQMDTVIRWTVCQLSFVITFLAEGMPQVAGRRGRRRDGPGTLVARRPVLREATARVATAAATTTPLAALAIEIETDIGAEAKNFDVISRGRASTSSLGRLPIRRPTGDTFRKLDTSQTRLTSVEPGPVWPRGLEQLPAAPLAARPNRCRPADDLVARNTPDRRPSWLLRGRAVAQEAQELWPLSSSVPRPIAIIIRLGPLRGPLERLGRPIIEPTCCVRGCLGQVAPLAGRRKSSRLESSGPWDRVQLGR